MSFVSLMRPGQLPEKPWTANAIVRLVASIMVGFMIGGTAVIVFRYFGGPEKTSALLVIAFSACAIGSFVGALVFLALPWPQEDFLLRLIEILGCVYAGLMFMWLADRLVAETAELPGSIVTMAIAALSFQGMALVLVHFFLREHHTGWAEGFGLRKNFAQALLLGTVASLLALFVTLSLQTLLTLVLERLALHPHEQEAVEILRNTDDWPDRLVGAIATILIAPVAEEVLFRGILYPGIKRMGYPRLALWGTAILFGTIHFNLVAFVPLTLLALILVWLYEYTGNLLACITTHCLFNAANFVFLYVFQK